MVPPEIALFLWPVVAAILFARCRLSVALIWTMFAGYLLLPSRIGIDLPLLPNIDKHFVPAMSALAAVLIILRSRNGTRKPRPEGYLPAVVLDGWIPRGLLVRVMIVALIAGAFLTASKNGDVLVYGAETVLPAMRTYDAFSIVLNMFVLLLPMLLARKFLAHPNEHRVLLGIFCIAAFAYSFLALWEVRMSPQLNRTLYGYFPHAWLQHIRGDGFRPLVFLKHGLFLGIFLCGAVVAALGYMRSGTDNRRWLYLGLAVWLLGTLYLSKNLGATALTLLLIPTILIFGVRLQMLIAALVAAIVITYPLLRGADMIPIDRIVALAEQINPDRAQSLKFRLDNEDLLLGKANERPLTGWGGWDRSRVFDDRGRDITITDGHWVIVIGQGGWLRYLAEFGLLTIGLLTLGLRQNKYAATLATSALGLILAANLVDLLPNAGITPITWMMAGALIGRMELQRVASQAPQTQPGAQDGVLLRQPTRYGRPKAVQGEIAVNTTTHARTHTPNKANTLATQEPVAPPKRVRKPPTYTRQPQFKTRKNRSTT